MKNFALLGVVLVFLSGNYACGMDKNNEYEKFDRAAIEKLKRLPDLAYFKVFIFANRDSYFCVEGTQNNIENDYACEEYGQRSKYFTFLRSQSMKEKNKKYATESLVSFNNNNDTCVETFYLAHKAYSPSFFQTFLKKKLIVDNIEDLWGNYNFFTPSIPRWKFISYSGRSLGRYSDEGSNFYKRKTLREYLQKNQTFLAKKYDLDVWVKHIPGYDRLTSDEKENKRNS